MNNLIPPSHLEENHRELLASWPWSSFRLARKLGQDESAVTTETLLRPKERCVSYFSRFVFLREGYSPQLTSYATSWNNFSVLVFASGQHKYGATQILGIIINDNHNINFGLWFTVHTTTYRILLSWHSPCLRNMAWKQRQLPHRVGICRIPKSGSNPVIRWRHANCRGQKARRLEY